MDQLINEPGPSKDSGGGSSIGGILGALALGYSAYQGARNQKKQNQANKELAEYQYSKELEMWNRQNEYNSPQSQMQRYQQAGLNPNMIYGSGSASAGNSSTLPKYQAPQLNYSFNPAEQMLQAIPLYQDFRFKNAQIDNLKAQTENTRVRSINEGINTELKNVGVDTGKFKLGQSQALSGYQLEVAKGEAHRQGSLNQQALVKTRTMGSQEQNEYLRGSYLANQIDQQGIDRELKEAELLFRKYRNDWTKMGITSGDNVFLRMLVRMGHESGLDSFNSLNPFKK